MAFPGIYNISYYRGDTYSFVVSPKDSTGDAIDLTDYSAVMEVATKRGGDTGDGVANITATVSVVNGTISVTIPAATGAGWTGGATYYYDLKMTKGAEVYTVLTGSLTVSNDVVGPA